MEVDPGQSPLRILVITWNFPPKTGGIEKVIYHLWDHLRTRHTMFVIAPYAKEETISDVHHIFRPQRRGLLTFMLYALTQGLRLCRRSEVDLIWAGSGGTAAVSFLLGKLCDKPVVTNVYGLDLTYSSRFYQGLLRWTLPRSNHVCTISEASKQLALEKGVPEGKISIIYPGVDVESFQVALSPEQLKRKYSLEGRKVLLSVGRLAKRKGIVEFVREGLPQIVEQVPEVLYLIAGDAPVDAFASEKNIGQLLKEEVERQHLERSVRWLGRVSDQTLVELYAACDLFLLPAIPVEGDIEGFGMVFIEANAAGKPAIGTRIGGIPDAIEPGVSGVLVEPLDYSVLASEIVRLLQDDAERERLGRSAQARARDHFDWQVIGKQYADIFARLAGGESDVRSCSSADAENT